MQIKFSFSNKKIIIVIDRRRRGGEKSTFWLEKLKGFRQPRIWDFVRIPQDTDLRQDYKINKKFVTKNDKKDHGKTAFL